MHLHLHAPFIWQISQTTPAPTLLLSVYNSHVNYLCHRHVNHVSKLSFFKKSCCHKHVKCCNFLSETLQVMSQTCQMLPSLWQVKLICQKHVITDNWNKTVMSLTNMSNTVICVLSQILQFRYVFGVELI